jgi:hypothetical protein
MRTDYDYRQLTTLSAGLRIASRMLMASIGLWMLAYIGNAQPYHDNAGLLPTVGVAQQDGTAANPLKGVWVLDSISLKYANGNDYTDTASTSILWHDCPVKIEVKTNEQAIINLSNGLEIKDPVTFSVSDKNLTVSLFPGDHQTDYKWRRDGDYLFLSHVLITLNSQSKEIQIHTTYKYKYDQK